MKMEKKLLRIFYFFVANIYELAKCILYFSFRLNIFANYLKYKMYVYNALREWILLNI